MAVQNMIKVELEARFYCAQDAMLIDNRVRRNGGTTKYTLYIWIQRPLPHILYGCLRPRFESGGVQQPCSLVAGSQIYYVAFH